MRQAEVVRETRETAVRVNLDLDGTGNSRVVTGIGFFDHMLSLLAKHAGFDLEVTAQGDLQVDGHHTVEDTGICLGRALNRARGEGAGIARFGHAVLPMDEALVLVAVDVSGRGFLAYDVPCPVERVGDFACELGEEFLRALAVNGGFTLHVRLLAGNNGHHILEAVFKGLAVALRMALRLAGTDLPSTKGVL